MNRYTFKVSRHITTKITVDAETDDDAYDRARYQAIRLLAEDFPENVKSREQNTEVECIADEPIDPLAADDL